MDALRAAAILARTPSLNAEHVRDTVMRRVAKAVPNLRLVVCDLSTSPHVDLGAAQMLAELHEQLSSLDIRLRIVEARSSVRDRLRREHLEEKVGGVDRLRSPSDVVDEFLGGILLESRAGG